ncbi:MAG: DUF4443 domain-containing protein [Candidatus Bathyarchaeia archaeon]
MSVKEFLESLMLEKAPGPRPSFSVLDVIKVLELIAKTGSVGRGRIAGETGLGEGSTRTLINRLVDAGLIAISKGGCALTEKGRMIWDEITAIMPYKVELGKNELTLASFNVAVLVKGRGERIKKGLEQRDAAVSAGGKCIITLVFRNNKLILPSISNDLAKDFASTFKQITNTMTLEENDVVIICGAENFKDAEYGALAATWTII